MSDTRMSDTRLVNRLYLQDTIGELQRKGNKITRIEPTAYTGNQNVDEWRITYEPKSETRPAKCNDIKHSDYRMYDWKRCPDCHEKLI